MSGSFNKKNGRLMREAAGRLNPRESKVHDSQHTLNEILWIVFDEDKYISMSNSKYTYYPRFVMPMPFSRRKGFGY